MYDYFLGGTDNYTADREACAQLLKLAPSTRELALNNRAFLVRAVRYLAAECGVRQFMDYGSGLPTQPNVHQVAHEADRNARVVYIDNDPIVLGHGRMMLQEDPETTAVLAEDIRHTDAIFRSAEVKRLIRNEPTAALFVSVLHCIPDEHNPWQLVRDVAQRLPAGSYLVICQLASDDETMRNEATRFMRDVTGGRWGRVRSVEEVSRYFDGLELQKAKEPCEVSRWYPDTEVFPRQATQEWIEHGGVARIPYPLPDTLLM